jgi:hypothetical protein
MQQGTLPSYTLRRCVNKTESDVRRYTRAHSHVCYEISHVPTVPSPMPLHTRIYVMQRRRAVLRAPVHTCVCSVHITNQGGAYSRPATHSLLPVHRMGSVPRCARRCEQSHERLRAPPTPPCHGCTVHTRMQALRLMLHAARSASTHYYMV